MATVAAYADRVGADHMVLTEPQLRIVPKASARSENALRLGYLPIFEKEAAFAYLQDYDAIAIIDADIAIMDKAPDVFAQLGDADFAGVLERDLPLAEPFQRKVRNYSRDQFQHLTDVNWHWRDGSAAFYNMGMMLLAGKVARFLNGQTPKQFIERPEFERFVNGEGKHKWSTDQVLLNYWVRKSGMAHKAIDWRFNALYSYLRPAVPRPWFVHFNLVSKMPQGGDEIPKIIRGLAA
jgi:hypothetical protein